MAQRGYPPIWTVYVSDTAFKKEHRMLQAWELRNRVRNFQGDLYHDTETGRKHLTFRAKGRDLAIVFATEQNGSVADATVVTQMHQKTDYESDDRYERVIR